MDSPAIAHSPVKNFRLEELIPDIRRLLSTRYRVTEEELNDLTQEVALRILRTQNSNPYDPNRAQISTYLVWNIRTVFYLWVQAKNKTNEIETVPFESIRGDEKQEKEYSEEQAIFASDNNEREIIFKYFSRFLAYLKKHETETDFGKPSNFFNLMALGYTSTEILEQARVVNNEVILPDPLEKKKYEMFPTLKEKGCDKSFFESVKYRIKKHASAFTKLYDVEDQAFDLE